MTATSKAVNETTRAALAGRLRDVAVLYGGRSSERDVSLQSGREVLAALTDALPEGARLHAIELEIDGRWSWAGVARDPLAALVALPPDTVFFLGLHGGEGENGTIQALLSLAGRRWTGSGVGASSLCMNKHATRAVLADDGLCVAPGRRVLPDDWSADRRTTLASIAALGPGPWFVKPNEGGSSVGMARATELDAVARAIDAIVVSGESALVEQGVRGVEATCGVLGNRRAEPRAFTPVEIRPRSQAYFDYHEKYAADGALELCPPEGLSERSVERLRVLGVRAHKLAGCDGYSRVDFIVPVDDVGRQGEPVVLEINTLPGFTRRSLLPRAAAHDGLPFGALCLEILRLALEVEPSGTR